MLRFKIWTVDEISFLKDNYKKYGAKYCAEKLNRTIKAVFKKSRFIGISTRQFKWNFDRDAFIETVKNSRSIKEILLKLGLRAAGGNYSTIKKYIKLAEIDTSHFISKAEIIKNVTDNWVRKPIEYYLISHNDKTSSTNLKERLYKEGLKQRQCELCGQGEMWMNKKMSLILDHINGNHYDYRFPNLRIVCPNCNSTLETHCRGHKYLENKKIKDEEEVVLRKKFNEEYRIRRRKVKDRPTLEQLIKDTEELGFLGTGRKYNVSDTAIRKWIKLYKSMGE